jgi:hypothetical protein
VGTSELRVPLGRRSRMDAVLSVSFGLRSAESAPKRLEEPTNDRETRAVEQGWAVTLHPDHQAAAASIRWPLPNPDHARDH